MTFTTRMLTPETWEDFAALVEANNGVWGGCWCVGFHPEGLGARYPWRSSSLRVMAGGPMLRACLSPLAVV